jgi:hypothetical protein
VLGTRATAEVEEQRVARCTAFVGELQASHGRVRRMLLSRRLPDTPIADSEAAGRAIVAAVGRHCSRTHTMVLGLVDELCAIGGVADAGEDQRWVSISSRPIDLAR